MQDFEQKVTQAAQSIKDMVGSPRIGIFINSKFEPLAYNLEGVDIISCFEIPNFPQSLMYNYENMIFGTIQGKPIICVYNNCNNYKQTKQDIKFSIEMLKKIGVQSIIFTNAVEGTEKEFNLGDLVLVKDHINIFGQRYNFNKQEMLELAKTMAQILDIDLKETTYGDKPKDYISTNNINNLYTYGCNATGSATIDEICIANQYDINILEISYIINLANTFIQEDTSATLEQAKENLMMLFKEIIAVL